MQYEFESTLAMIKSVHYALNSNSDIISCNPKLVENINIFNEFINKIPQTLSKIDQQSNIKTEKVHPEEQFSRIVLQVVNKLNSFASMVENIDLMTETMALKNNIHKLQKYDLLESGRKVFHYLIENFLSLEHFGISEITIKEFETKMRNFDKYLSNLDNSKTSVDYSEDEDFSIDELLIFIEETLDKQVKLLRLHYPKFYNEYQKSRTIKEVNNSSSNGDLSFRYFY
jgi:hypothetical protein